MKALVSGTAGFIYSHLADYLIEQGMEVVGIDNLMTGDMENVNPKVKFYNADIRNLKKIQRIFKKEKPDFVFHGAANCRTMVSVDDPRLNNDINITGTLNMLIASRDHAVRKFISASSCIVYAPNTPYYVSKLAGEEYCKVFRKIYGLPTVSLRYSNVYGSLRQSEKGSHINAIASLRKTKRETGRIWLTGDGTQTRDWSHVLDICRANYFASRSGATGVYDICTGVQTSMNKIAKYFECPIDFVPKRPGDVKDLSKTQDPKPALKDFGYRSKIKFGADTMGVYL